MPWFTASLRHKALAVAGAGLLTAAGAYCVERWLEDDAGKAALSAGLDALIVIFVGIVITAVLDQRANERTAALERQRRAAVRTQLLDLLGPSLKLAATGWVHRPGLSAPHDEDLSVRAGRDALVAQAQGLAAAELRLKRMHEHPPPNDSIVLTILWLSEVRSALSAYWLEGSSAARFRHLSHVRAALPAVLRDADESLRVRFAAFGAALDLADAAKFKTDLVAQERLVIAPVGEPLGSSAMARENPDVASALRSVAELTPRESVLHMLIVADVFERRGVELREDPPAGFRPAVVGTLNRCLGALEHEVANAHVALLRLIELLDLLAPGDPRSE